MSRNFRHLREDWEVQVTGSAIASGFGTLPEISSWGVKFSCVSNPAIGSFQGSLRSINVPDLEQVPEDELEESLEAAVSVATARLITALEDPKWDWRTAEGVAKDTGLPREQVAYLLNSDPETFIRSQARDKNGRSLYSTRDHYAQRRGFFDRLRST